ncbi:Ion transport protein-domain-containing protein [Hypoxylon sp. FL1284]|nr:Ion transport protein-domain-containing protein [Hypoxylon sp. FL1284]
MTRSSSPRQSQQDSSTPPSQSIPLQDLARQQHQHASQPQAGDQSGSLADRNLPGISTYWEGFQNQQRRDGAGLTPTSPIDAAALQFALPPGIQPAPSPRSTPLTTHPYATETPYYDDETAHVDYFESDSSPLTSAAQPISGALATPQVESQPRDSFQTVSSLDNSRPRGRSTQMLGVDLETGYAPDKHHSYGNSLAPNDNRASRAPGTASALYRAGSIVRAMSQRVVNISGEGESFEQQQQRRQRSRSPSVDGRISQIHPPAQAGVDTSYPSQVYPSNTEKNRDPEWTLTETPLPPRRAGPMPNPLKGHSLGIFGPDNAIRRKLCDVLVNPYLEPILLLLIVLQAVLLAVEAANNVFDPGNGRPSEWDPSSGINWALFILFIIFTLELVVRIIVSGFVLNAAEYSTIDRKKGVRAAISDQYNAVFRPQRQKSVKTPREPSFGPSTFARSFTMMHGSMPETVEEQQRMQLARRAFLRHGFNRLDFIAVVSFWIAFVLSISGIEMREHVFIFRMLSCLRIVRLLALTNGTAIILRSLKKAAPLLVRVSFLLGFFWLLFAIIGIQSFKASLSRQCVWRDPDDPDNFNKTFTNDFQFCGGFLDQNGTEQPWVRSTLPGNPLLHLENGSDSPKGYICPRNSICLEQTSPFNNTVNFDNIPHSLELVFVIMSANTWSDLMYYTTYSEFLAAAIFFGAGIMIMMLWLTNLLIAVITSSFQVIREESKASAFTADEDFQIPGLQDERLQRVSTLQKIYNKTSLIWVFLITYDLACQAWRSSDMSQTRENFINVNSVVITILLDVEIAFRFAANWRAFHRTTGDLFDLFLALANTIIILPPIYSSGQTYSWLTIFQILRSYRVVMAISITRQLIVLVLGNATGIGNLIIFVFLITFIMAIFAVQLFRGEIPLYDDDSGELIRISFYNIFNSFLGMYQILSSENWTDILYTVTSYTTVQKTSWYGAMFLIGWFILSFFILVNMFIAVIQENFDVSEDEKRLEQVKAFLQRKELGSNASTTITFSDIFSFGKSKRRDPLDYGPATMEMLLKDAVVREFLDETMDPLHQESTNSPSPREGAVGGGVRPGFLSTMWGKIRNMFSDREPNPFYSNIRFNGPNDTLDPRQMARQAVSATAERRKAQREYLARHPTYNNALYIFTPQNPIRRFCQRLVGPGRGNERFDGVEPNKVAWYAFTALIYAAIIAMVLLACITTPLYQKEYLETHQGENRFKSWFVWVDLGFAVLFTVEAAIKIIADGWFFTPNAYYRSSWGIIDGVVLITLWINVLALLASDGAVSRVIGAFKALRALRLLNISNSARDTFHSLIIVAGWKIMSAALVSLSLLVPFAIYALNLFHGQLLQCNDDSLDSLVDCFGEYESSPSNPDWPLLAPRVADNQYFSFDDFPSSLFILFQIVSQEGWVDVSFAAQAITGHGNQPQDMSRQGNGMFFVVFNLLGTVFVLTLFISVFMRNYTEQTGVAFLTAEQRSWLELRKLLRQISPSRSSYDETENKWKKWCHKRAIEKRGKWYTAITAVLVLHLILLMLEYYPEPDAWATARNIVFSIFTLIYIANIVIRIVGLGWKRFRRSSWDVFSLISVFGTFIATILLVTQQGNQTFVQLQKYFLDSIVLLLIPRNDALDQLFKTAAASLTTIVNLLATWLVFFLVFAIALTQTFSLTRFGGNEDVNINFRTVPNALILLFRMSVGEGWNEIMEDYATIEPPLCVDAEDFFNSDCGSLNWARFLFIAWNLISMYIFVNLFISLIFESFSYVYQRSSGMAHIDRDEIRRFKEAWRSVDPNGTGYITKEAFPRLLGELSGIFEMRIYDAEDSIRQILEDVRNDDAHMRHSSLANTSNLGGLNIKMLNERLANIDVRKVQERRRRFNIFYEEIMVSADPVQGISFTTVLMIMAHYKIISDSKSLRLEEFLRRRARLQRVEEEVRRRVVVGFFDTVYWSRRFKRHMDKKRSARMTAIPQLDVPDIFVDDEDDRQRATQQRTTMTAPPARTTSADFLAVSDAARPQHRSWSSSADISTYDSSQAHPLSLPRASPSMPGHQSQASAFSFELQDPGTAPGSASSSRRGSAVSPAQVRELLDDSVWVESIRRSATIRRSVRR